MCPPFWWVRFFGFWFILLFVFPLCHTSSLALFGFSYTRIYSSHDRIHPCRRAQSIFQRCPCCWKGSRQEDILSQGLTQIFYNPFQDRHHGVLPYLPLSPFCFTFIEFWCAFQSFYVCSETLGTRFTSFCLKKKFEN